MTTRLTLFLATLVQDSALSVSGIDRENASDQPFAMVEGKPILSGRGLKGAAVAMARRFFDPLPLFISGRHDEGEDFRRSAWEFDHARPCKDVVPVLRAGVGILQKTGARANGVLFDREVIPSGSTWQFEARVNWRYAENTDGEAAEGILRYVLEEHWARGRCWLGGGVARGLGWCHLKELQMIRLDEVEYEKYIADRKKWVEERSKKAGQSTNVAQKNPIEPTRSWFFRTLEVKIQFGEYKPNSEKHAWGVDMFAVGPHDLDRRRQDPGTGTWAKASENETATESIETNRALLMEGNVPLLPGSSVRGPLRHAFSRARRAAGETIQDPHTTDQHDVGENDEAGKVFGTVNQSSSLLIRDARAEGDWVAANLHAHAEDEFSAGAYGTSKRTAVRILQASFPVQMVVEGSDAQHVDTLVAKIDKLIALGKCGHLPIGADKTRGAGWGIWKPADKWIAVDVQGKAAQTNPNENTKQLAPANSNKTSQARPTSPRCFGSDAKSAYKRVQESRATAYLVCDKKALGATQSLTLGDAAKLARQALGIDAVAWWCEPTLDLSVTRSPLTFGWGTPENANLLVDEVMFFAPKQCWHAAKTQSGWRSVHWHEVPDGTHGAIRVEVLTMPGVLHQDGTRFGQANLIKGKRKIAVREWHNDEGRLGYTMTPFENKENA